MKGKVKFVLILVAFILLVGMSVGMTLTSASEQVSIQGTAIVINTGSNLDFDGYNSKISVDSSTGITSGYVWSEDLGWVDFGNNGGLNPVTIDLNDGGVTGVAYILNTGGVIDFSSNNSNVIVDVSGNTVSGYGWSEDLGWIDFSTVRLSGPFLSLSETGQEIFLMIIFASFLLGISAFVFWRVLRQGEVRNFRQSNEI